MSKTLAVDIPLEVNDKVNDIFPSGENREFIIDATLSLAEQNLCIMTFAEQSYKAQLGELRAYRNTRTFKPTLAENTLFHHAMINNSVIEVKSGNKNFSLTNCRRARIYLNLPSGIIELIDLARGKQNINNFITLSVFNWLSILQGGNTMQTRQQYIQAQEREDLPASKRELEKLRAKVARLEIERNTNSASLELIGEVLIQLINEAAKRTPIPDRLRGEEHVS